MATWTAYPIGILNMLNGTIDLDSHTFKVALLNSSGTYNSAHDEWADVSANEISSANGYTTPGQNLGSPTLTNNSGTIEWSGTDPVWTASGGSIGPTENAVIYDDTSTGDKLVCHLNFTAQTAASGATLTIDLAAGKILTFA